MKDAESSLNNLKDCLQVLKVAKAMIPSLQGQFGDQMEQDMEMRGSINRGDDQMGLIDGENSKSINIQHVAGVVDQTEIERLRRLIFRSTKGKSYMYIQEYEDKTAVKKRSVYIIVFWDGEHIRDRIQKICDSFSGQRYELPDLREIAPQIEKVQKSIADAKNIFERTKQSLRDQLIQFDKIEVDADGSEERKTSSTIYIYKMFLAKEKALYRTLNQMKWQNQSFIGYFWAPIDQENTIKSALSKYSAAKIVAYDNHTIPRPTYFKTTDVTAVFQLIVDTYGVPTYLEANPVPVSIVTFPFFFGMMFGDMGHGSLFLSLGIYLCLFNNSVKTGALSFMAPFRYLVLLMGIMACYCGFIYNEWFAIPTEFFASCYNGESRMQWNATQTDGTLENTSVIAGEFVFLRKSFDCVYPFGQDPVWGLTTNKLNLSNNIKMKLAVIMGVLHMSIGIIIKGTNTIYFGRWADFWTEVAAGLCILLGLFGWMDALVIAKWFHRVDIEDTSASMDIP
jgi:V-type H+-transporting ATPase subunit a